MNIAAYISGHGFGHLAQMAPVLNRMHATEPNCRFLIRCALSRTEIRARLNFDFELEQTPVDAGVVQKSAIEEDRDASIRQMRDWVAHMDEQLEREVELLRRFSPCVAVSDISPLAFPAAKQLAIPGIGLATLDWHTIYTHWLAADDPALATLADAYHACDLLLKPPMAMDMNVFPHQREISLIAAQPTTIPDPVSGDARKKALVLFGGCGNPTFDIQALAAMHDWLFLIPDAPQDAPENVTSIHLNADLGAVDLMGLVDVVVCKPGYGVLSECWRTATPIAWVERPDFPEFPMLKKWLNDSMPSASMTRCCFQQGNWLPALQAARMHQRCFPAISGDGADEAAKIILAHTW